MGLHLARGFGMFCADRSIPYNAGEYSSSLTLPPSLYALYACAMNIKSAHLHIVKQELMQSSTSNAGCICMSKAHDIFFSKADNAALFAQSARKLVCATCGTCVAHIVRMS